MLLLLRTLIAVELLEEIYIVADAIQQQQDHQQQDLASGRGTVALYTMDKWENLLAFRKFQGSFELVHNYNTRQLAHLFLKYISIVSL